MVVKVTVGRPSPVDPHKPGRPPLWTASQSAALWADVELLRERNARLSDRSACELLAKSDKWGAYARTRLQKELIESRKMHSSGLIGEVVSEEEDAVLRHSFLEMLSKLR